jgi:hypothetical protein
MANLYADEDMDHRVVAALRRAGHDVLTAQDAGLGNRRVSDPDQWLFAVGEGRALLTFNRRHYIPLAKKTLRNPGLIVCTRDAPGPLADRIHLAILAHAPLDNRIIRVNRPHTP